MKAESREKLSVYSELVQFRRNCFLCKDTLCNTASIKNYSKFDDEINPWTRWQGNLNSDIMVVGQDWGNVKHLKLKMLNKDIDEDMSSRTNRNLIYLINSISNKEIDLQLQGRKGKHFFTNAVLCLRYANNPLQEKVDPSWLDNCVGEKKFLRQQIMLVNPKVVIGLGKVAFNSILRSFDIKPKKQFIGYVEDKKGVKLHSSRATAFAVYHCGATITNTIRPLEEQLLDWQRIGKFLNTK